MRRSILYPDDDASHLELFRELFGAEYDLRTTTGVAAARRMSVEYAPGIVSRNQRPGSTGTEFLRVAARLCPACIRVLLPGARTVGACCRKSARPPVGVEFTELSAEGADHLAH